MNISTDSSIMERVLRKDRERRDLADQRRAAQAGTRRLGLKVLRGLAVGCVLGMMGGSLFGGVDIALRAADLVVVAVWLHAEATCA